MRHITDRMIVTAINQMEERFDAHDLEKRLLRQNPVAVAREIIEHRRNRDILRSFSAKFAKYVDRTFAGRIRKTAKVDWR